MNLLIEISDKLMESINKSKAVVDLLRTADSQNIAKETLGDIGWLLAGELDLMEKQVDRLS